MKERNIVKTTIWMIASALVFVAATVAWFGLNSQSSVGPASTNIESKGISVKFERYNEDNGEWTEVDLKGGNIVLDDLLIPGDSYQFRAVLGNAASNVNLAMHLNNIIVENGNTQDVLERIYAQVGLSDNISGAGAVYPAGEEALFNYYNEETQKVELLNGAELQGTADPNAETPYIYFTFSVPGNPVDANGNPVEHNNTEDISFEGAHLRIGSITVYSSASAE